MREKYLRPVKETTEDYEAIEQHIRDLFKREIYLPLIRIIDPVRNTITNARPGLLDALMYGQVQFYRGTFSGRFNATISKELKAIGARWDSRSGTWKLSQSSLPVDVQNAIKASESHFLRKMQKIDDHLSKILPEEIADKLKASKFLDSTLWKVDRDIRANMRNIQVPPQLTKEQRKTIADEWQNNMKIDIKDWTETAIKKLRREMKESVYAGNRYETAIKTISKSYGVSLSKAKFLARQETNLLMSKFKEVRYKDAGIKKYKWRCVTGSPAHPVRHSHKILDGKVFSWENPRELDKNGRVNPNGAHKPGENKNPGEDYNCRCTAVPIVEFGG